MTFLRVYVLLCGWLAYGLALFFLHDEAVKANQSGDMMTMIASMLLKLAAMLAMLGFLEIIDPDKQAERDS